MDSPDIIFEERSGGVRASMMLNGERISGLTIVPFTIRIGRADVRMDGIGGVWTAEKHRMKGLSRQVMETAITRMAAGDAPITMLYGIRNFYEKFGYATVGPDHGVLLTDLEKEVALPQGWTTRDFVHSDYPAVRALYDLTISRSSGARVRADDAYSWRRLLDQEQEPEKNICRLILGPDRKIHGYAWFGHWCHTVTMILANHFPRTFIIAEAAADGPAAADAVLAMCKQWGAEAAADGDYDQVLIPVPADTHLAAAAMRMDARLVGRSQATGNSMIRVLDVRRLLEALAPEIELRLTTARSPFSGTLTIATDIGGATLVIDGGKVSVEEAREDGLIARMPQSSLGPLALGAYPPEDVLARLPEPPAADAAELLRTIFPLRHPQMYIPDRF